MSDALADENGAHIRTLSSLFPRLEPLIGNTEGFRALLAQYKEVERGYSIAYVQATQNCRSRQICAGDAKTVFRLTISPRKIEDALLKVAESLLGIVDQCIASMTAADQKSDTRQCLKEYRRVIQRLHESVHQCAFGESRGARSMTHLDEDDDSCDDCCVSLLINAEHSEKVCPQCARVYRIFGVVFDEAQLHQQEGQRGKSGCFSPSQHYEEWMRNILALESEELLCKKGIDENPAGLIDRLRCEAQRRNKIIAMLTVEDVRVLLKAIGRTDLNAHTSLIMKKLTGTGPPAISRERRVEAGSMFSRVLSVRESLTENSGNRLYYPYYTIKIFDLILPRGDADRRVFQYIHMQSADTLHKNDTEWRRICAELDWEYRPTDPAVLQ